ncbi:MAG: rRNA maturation RNase YbeY [Candidatus Nealsonbacteria bacterium]|nr:rRNA maturation RNase YbeY [Candidatus Nealsonbacteria bacterium]
MIEVSNLTKEKIGSKDLKDIAKRVLKSENKEGLAVSIGLVSSREIERLNREYRKKNRPTDVLSFLYEDSGEIVLCPEVIRKNAKAFGTSFKKELNRILIHGLLHLVGCDHEGSRKEAAKMEEKENHYLIHAKL